MESLIVLGAKYLFAVIVVGAATPLLWLPRKERWAYLTTAVICGILAFGLTKLAGNLYFDPRPFTHGVRSLIPHEADNGFPSDHTVLSFTAALLCLRVSKPYGAALLILAGMVAASRVLAGVHETLDVVAAAAIGGISVVVGGWFATVMARPRKIQTDRNEGNIP